MDSQFYIYIIVTLAGIAYRGLKILKNMREEYHDEHPTDVEPNIPVPPIEERVHDSDKECTNEEPVRVSFVQQPKPIKKKVVISNDECDDLIEDMSLEEFLNRHDEYLSLDMTLIKVLINIDNDIKKLVDRKHKVMDKLFK